MDYERTSPEGASPRARPFISHKALHTMLHLLYIPFTNMIGLLAKSATVATRFGLFSPHQIGILAVTKVASARYPGLATRFNGCINISFDFRLP